MHMQDNDTDWLHRTFLDIFENHQRLQNVDGVQREHSLYGPQATRLSWIYPPSHHFLVKPQALLMPEVFVDHNNAADTSTTSIEAVDGDVSHDSMGGHVVSQWRDLFMQRDRREVDLVVTKKIPNGPQVPLLVVEIKRDNLDLDNALRQIEDYMKRIVIRRVSLGHLEMPVLGLLVLGAFSIRMVTNWDKKTKKAKHTYWDRDDEGGIIFVDSDSKAVNELLLTQSLAYLNV